MTEDIEMNPTDQTAIELLSEGRITPSYLAEQHGCTRQNASSRLNRLVEHDYVQRVHRGLYELVEDPRENSDQ